MSEIKSDVYEFVQDKMNIIDLIEIESMTMEEVTKRVVDLGIFKDERSVKLFLANYSLQAIYNEDMAYPIAYMGYEEEISEEEKYIDSYNLTDDMIRNII